MRPKLVPNYSFDPHTDASRLRDNLGKSVRFGFRFSILLVGCTYYTNRLKFTDLDRLTHCLFVY